MYQSQPQVKLCNNNYALNIQATSHNTIGPGYGEFGYKEAPLLTSKNIATDNVYKVTENTT